MMSETGVSGMPVALTRHGFLYEVSKMSKSCSAHVLRYVISNPGHIPGSRPDVYLETDKHVVGGNRDGRTRWHVVQTINRYSSVRVKVRH